MTGDKAEQGPLHESNLRMWAKDLRAQPEAAGYEAILALLQDPTTRSLGLIMANRVLREKRYLEAVLRYVLQSDAWRWIPSAVEYLTPRLGKRRMARTIAAGLADGTISEKDASLASYYLGYRVRVPPAKDR